MLLLGTKNVGSQTVLTGGTVNIGNVYRQFCRRTRAGLPTFSTTSTGVTLNGQGIYKVTATVTGSGTAAGVLTVQLNENGTAIPGALASTTITTANTEVRTLTLDYFVKVDEACNLGVWSVAAKTLTLTNTGVGATFTNVVFNIEKVVG